jgi:hypothetical protein
MTTLMLWFSLAEETVFASFGNRRRKNGFVARVATRRGLFQGLHKGVYLRLKERPKELRRFSERTHRIFCSDSKKWLDSNSLAAQ